MYPVNPPGLSEALSKQHELKASIEAVSQPRTDYQLKHFVVGQHESPERRFLQIVIELQRKMITLRRTKIELKKAYVKLQQEPNADERELTSMEVEEIEFAVVGAVREFNCLYAMFDASPKFTHEQIQAAEQGYWETRLARQASLDLEATGRIGVGNLDALRQAEMLPNIMGKMEELKLTLAKPTSSGVKHALVP